MRPDLPALDRTFDYLVPEAATGDVRVGTIVRIPLHGRRVRGWVIADDVVAEADPARLLPLSKVVGAGPPEELIELGEWAAWRWAGSPVTFLRAASAPNAVRDPWPEVTSGAVPDWEHQVLAWPPAADRRGLVVGRLAVGGSTLVIVPDGARLGALVRHLQGAGHRVLVLRGDAPHGQRTRAWSDARRGGCVVVGGRAACWAPVPDLAAVIVLDEGDESLQDERSPTWHARDLMVERARRAGAAITLVAPVPTPEAEALCGPPTRPDRAIEREGWPLLEVVDLRDEAPGVGLVTDGLATALHRAIDADGRALCVLNRKGRARLLACVKCRELTLCESCGAAVSESDAGTLRCTQCGTERPMVCLACHGTRLKAIRPGISRLREDLAALLPRARVAEVDATTDDVPNVEVLVGTEAVLHRIPAGTPVRVVAFLDLDQELAAPRYRAAQHALALITRAARVLGPRDRGGRLVVQTRMPDHEVLETVRSADPTPARIAEDARRRALGYPPHGALAEVSGATEAVRAALDPLVGWPDITVLGPTDAGAGLRALVRASTVDELCDALATAAALGRAAGRLRVAVDPPRV